MRMEAGLSAHKSRPKKKELSNGRKRGETEAKKNDHVPFLPLGLCELAGVPQGLCPGAGQHPGAKCPPPPASANSSEEGRPTAVESRACGDLSRATDQVTAQLAKEKLAFKK